MAKHLSGWIVKTKTGLNSIPPNTTRYVASSSFAAVGLEQMASCSTMRMCRLNDRKRPRCGVVGQDKHPKDHPWPTGAGEQVGRYVEVKDQATGGPI
jgi:hypothetical protein